MAAWPKFPQRMLLGQSIEVRVVGGLFSTVTFKLHLDINIMQKVMTLILHYVMYLDASNKATACITFWPFGSTTKGIFAI